MKLLILGATGRTGQQVIAAATGQHVTAFGRRKASGVSDSIVGEFGDKAFVRAVVEADAVLSCLASSNADPVCSRAAMAVLRAKPDVRFLTVAGAGVDQPGDAKGIGDKMIGAIMRLTVGRMLADRQKEVDMLAQSGAIWTALRPPRLTQGKATGHWQTSFARPQATWIDRADLARAMLAAIDDDALKNAAPFVSAKVKGTL